MKFRKIIGWVLVIMCIVALFQFIVSVVTISTSAGEEVYWAKRQLPFQLFLMVAYGWIAYYLLSKKKAPSIEKHEASAEKIKTRYKILIYLCEAIIVWVGTFIICGAVILITDSEWMMQLIMLVCIIGIIYFLPSPQKVFNYWQKRKHK